MPADISRLADEIEQAYARGVRLPSVPSSRPDGLDLDTAYAVEAELARRRLAAGRRRSGLKVGFANKAMWRVLKLDTLVWANMYDDTVHPAAGNAFTLPLGRRVSPRIEPEIVFKLKTAVPLGTTDAAAALGAVEWLAPGFEINDSLFPDWTFQPADFVAAYGLHTALVVGTPVAVTPASLAPLVEALPKCPVRLTKNGQLVEDGSSRNSLRSPALCLLELAAAIARRPGTIPLGPGDLVSTGTLTAAHPIAAGETWRMDVTGLPAGAEIDGLTLGLS